MSFFKVFSILCVMAASSNLIAMSAKIAKCPKEKQIVRKLQQEAYRKLIKLLGTGEGRKMDTPEKKAAQERYKFYSECLKR